MPDDEKTQDAPSHLGILLSWDAEEFEYYEKNKDWYWSVGIVSIGFFILAIILENWLFALLAVLGGFTVAMHGSKKPREIRFSITSRGILANDVLYPYDSLQHFWINYDPPRHKSLYLISKKLAQTQLNIPLGQADPNEVREQLLKFLDEREIEESLFDAIARFLRF